MFDIIAMGETLIDFTPAGCEANGSPLFAQNPGGAPANVLAQAARLGAKSNKSKMKNKNNQKRKIHIDNAFAVFYTLKNSL